MNALQGTSKGFPMARTNIFIAGVLSLLFLLAGSGFLGCSGTSLDENGLFNAEDAGLDAGAPILRAAPTDAGSLDPLDSGNSVVSSSDAASIDSAPSSPSSGLDAAPIPDAPLAPDANGSAGADAALGGEGSKDGGGDSAVSLTVVTGLCCIISSGTFNGGAPITATYSTSACYEIQACGAGLDASEGTCGSSGDTCTTGAACMAWNCKGTMGVCPSVSTEPTNVCDPS